jgi:hypothetical protein
MKITGKPALLATIVIFGFISAAHAQSRSAPPPSDCLDSNNRWMLLGVNIFTGVAVLRDTSKDVPLVYDCKDSEIPVYATKAKCLYVLNAAIKKYSGLPHSEGNYGRFLCTDLDTWRQGE